MDRLGETATLLHDGTVLIIGGGAADQAPTSSGGSDAEIFDPATGTVTQLGPTVEPHIDARGPLLAGDRVLIGGGTEPHLGTIALPEIYDPATQTFKRTALATEVWGPFTRAVPLDDERVLIVGGRNAADGGIRYGRRRVRPDDGTVQRDGTNGDQPATLDGNAPE